MPAAPTHPLDRAMVRSLEDIKALPLPEALKGMLAGDYADLLSSGSRPPMVVSFTNHAIAGRWTALRMVHLAGSWTSRVFSISEIM